MEAREGNDGGANLKRQREPLSDSEDNILSAPEMKDDLKRRRLEAAGQENRYPKSSSSGRLTELQTKPDTPIIPSVRSRVQLLTQRREAQRCLSDPGAEGPSLGVKEHLLGEGEFNQRLERFKAPVFQASPAPTTSPADPSLRSRSDFVSGIQQKLQCTTTPSSKQATRIRQERELELNQLPFHPISENAWLKRSSSDSSITHQGRTPAGSSSPSLSVPRSKRKVCWPPTQPWDQVCDDAEMKDGSFTETLTSAAGEGTSFKASAASAVLDMQKQNVYHGEEDGDENENKTAAGSEGKQPGSEPPETQTVIKLSFSEHHNLSELRQADERSFLQSTLLDEPSMKETSEMSKVTEEDRLQRFTVDEYEAMDESSYSEGGIEPSTDEELRIWRYPQSKIFEDEEPPTIEEQQLLIKEDEDEEEFKSSRENKEEGGFSNSYTESADVQDVKSESPVDVSGEAFGSSDQQKVKKPRLEEEELELRSSEGDSVKDQSDLEGNLLKSEACCCEKIHTQCDDSSQQLKQSQSVGEKHGAQSIQETLSENPDHQAGNDEDQGLTEIQVSDSCEMETDSSDVVEAETHKTERSKKVTFILEPELINSSVLTESDTSVESRAEMSPSDVELNSHNETNTAEIIDKMFEEVLEYAEHVEENGRLEEDHDSGIGSCSVVKDKMDVEKEAGDKEPEAKEEECDENRNLESFDDELLSFPPSGILSPLSKSVEAVVTPLRLAATQVADSSSLVLSPEGSSTPPAESAPLYSIDAYRTQRQIKLPAVQSVTPAVQRRTPEPQPLITTKEKITALNEEAAKLQTVISQTLQALSCCTDKEHGRGSLEEAEAEKLLLVSCEKRAALLAEVSRLREERTSESEKATKEDSEYISQQPCRGTVSITNIQLPLKVEFVCLSQSRSGQPSHYFFVLIRYGPCNIVATPLATAADARNGDTISFPTSITLKDIRSSFEIDIEVYSLSHSSGTSSSADRTSTKSRVTPRKLLNTITKSSYNLTCSAPSARRSSNFCLVGSHKLTLASLGCSKFPLDKMKFEGKVKRLLGDEFLEKVPFLSPLEGNIYLKLNSEGHSDVQHQGFLTMFELISGLGVWNRRYFVLEGCNMYYWNHPNDKETKAAEGSISLSRFPSQCVRPVKRDSCARPFTFELVNKAAQQVEQNQEPLSKCWFSADTKQERLDWMENLSQALVDFHTWNRVQAETPPSTPCGSGKLRESML